MVGLVTEEWMTTKRLAMLLLALSSAACAAGGARAARPPDEFRLADGTLVKCRMEAPTGSNIRERVCTREAEKTEANRNAIDSIMNRPVVQTRTGN
jgi:hypothetical protein